MAVATGTRAFAAGASLDWRRIRAAGIFASQPAHFGLVFA
jgi:hypothetical protein